LDSVSTDNDNDFGFRLIPADSGSCILDSVSTDDDNTLDSGSCILDSVSNDDDNTLDSGSVILDPRPTDNDNTLNSDKTQASGGNVHLIPLLRQALIKLAKNEYHSTVLDLDEFIRDFNQRTPDYKKTLGTFPVGNEARKLKIVGWR